ncbi:MAG: hypothetical protein U5J78_01070 [Parasphingorhabdus sp.]|nr:hypothetical protein [Parasphingorhabdus sp.]
MLKHIAAVLALLSPNMVHAESSVALQSDVFVERKNVKPDGSIAVTLEAPKMVVPGDNLVFVVKYQNVGSAPASNFSLTNPLPGAVAFNGTADGTETVSVDGGRTWGKLSALKIALAEGRSRPALMADVTHIKWQLARTLSVGASGKFMFRGTVR